MPAKLFLSILIAATVVLTCSSTGRAQNSGDAEVSFQGYYAADSGQSLSRTSGMGVVFNDFLPGVGMFKGSFQGYAFNSAFQSGENFLDMQGVPVLGYHWDVSGGDFHVSTSLVDNPFSNMVNPEVRARGFQLSISRTNRKVTFFGGEETLQEGPRVPFYVTAPQSVLGMTVEQSFGDRFRIGIRYLHLASSNLEIETNPIFFSENRMFRGVDSMAFQSSYDFTKHFKLFGETTGSYVAAAPGAPSATVPVSFFVGPWWETKKFSLRANYTYQGVSYLPLLGYYAGDRKGPYVEGHYHVSSRIDLYGSASHYENNLENDSEVPTFRSFSYTYGGSAVLPWKLSGGAQISDFWFDAQQFESSPAQNSRNRQISANVSRPAGKHHNFRFTFMDLKSVSNRSYQSQPSYEGADNFAWKWLVLGGGLRLQQQGGTQATNTLFFRGNAQVNFGRFSAYGYVERGNDFVASTVFAKNAYSSDVFGLSASIRRDWSMQLEAFRNNVTVNINPESIFVLGNQGVALPSLLSSFNHWSVYFRASRTLRWGSPITANTPGGMNAAALLPLVGSVEGFVVEQSQSGSRAVEGVPVSLDQNLVAMTDESGHYRFSEVPEGLHLVGLAERELPAEFEPDDVSTLKVQVEPRHVTRSDFRVVRLGSLTGKIVFPEGMPTDAIVIRISPGTRYTTPESDGSFFFYNLREGAYEVFVDEESLPDDAALVTTGRLEAAVQLDAPPAEIKFEIKVKQTEKPVRRLFEQKMILNGPGPGSAPAPFPPLPGIAGTGSSDGTPQEPTGTKERLR